MALPLGKIAILVGAGVVGSILAKEDSLPSVSSLFSGAFKLALKGIKQDSNSTPAKKPKTDLLMAQVDSIRQELQFLVSSRPVTVITTSGSSSNKYGAVVIVFVVGYGCIWLKGWKLTDLMFATRGSLAEARDIIAKEVKGLYSTISVTRRHLSSRIEQLNTSVDEVAELTGSTRDTITGMNTEVDTVKADVASILDKLENVKSKIIRIEANQDITNNGVMELVDFACSRTPQPIQASSSSSRPAIEPTNVTPPRIASLPAPSISNGYDRASASSSIPAIESANITPLLRMPSLPARSISNGYDQETNRDDEVPVQLGIPRSHQSANGVEANGRSGVLGLIGGFGSMFTRSQNLSTTARSTNIQNS